MDVSPNALRKETVQLLGQIERQIASVQVSAATKRIDPEQLRDERGNWVMSPLLLAKSQCLHTLTLLNEQGKRK